MQGISFFLSFSFYCFLFLYLVISFFLSFVYTFIIFLLFYFSLLPHVLSLSLSLSLSLLLVLHNRGTDTISFPPSLSPPPWFINHSLPLLLFLSSLTPFLLPVKHLCLLLFFFSARSFHSPLPPPLCFHFFFHSVLPIILCSLLPF